MPKDEIVKGTNKIARVKPIKNLGKNKEGELIQTQTVNINEKIGKVTDKSKTVNRYKDGKLVSSDYIPNKIKPKRIKKLKVKKRVPRKLKKVPVPSYTAPSVTLDEEDKKEIAKRERIANAKKKKKKLKIKLPKSKRNKRPKRRKTKNLVTGKYNYTQ
jgi:hypothetical protein